MKSGKAVGPDDIPVEVWKCLGEAAVEFLASLFNRVLESERMPEEWRRSVLVPIFKNKGDVQSCSNYRGIKLMSHTMKVWERVVEARLRKVVEICEQQYGFMPRKSTTDAIFALRILMEKYRDGQRELHCVFVDLEKAYDRVPREELWYCMRKSGVAEKYVRVVQDMYERSRTVVRCAVGQTEEFNVEVGLHQGLALSPFLFAIVMDQLSEEVRQESPWTMMFADDIVICSESREQVEENLERWRFALERRGMKVSRSKTEYMCVNEREGSGTVRLQGEEVKKVQEFKYLGSTVQSNGECGKEVKKRVQAGWNGWRKVSGVLCDQKISARIKGKVYRTVVRPAMLYGLETVSLRKRQESELEVAELKMLRFSLGVTRLDRIRNEYIRGTAHVGRLGDKVREARLRWFGHVQRRETWKEYPDTKENDAITFTQKAKNLKNALKVYDHLLSEYGADLQGHSLHLVEVASSIDKVHKGVKIANITGGAAGAVGVAAAVGGVLLAPLTAGASLAVAAVGVGVAAAGGVTGASAAITNKVHTNMDRKKVETILQEHCTHIGEIEKCVKIIGTNIEGLKKYNLSTLKGLDWKAVKMARIANNLGDSVGAIGAVSKSSGMIQGFSLGIDMYFSKEDSKQLKKGSEAKFAKQIRKISKHMQTCLDELMAFKTVINSEDMKLTTAEVN
ncbi:hypothetical protein QTP70_000728 [Hemibagrus guttatus]|uniref:ribonuclease H n=1 Tax=Hemibagrus guttatus TaxID=175788 RepID=A0AAE0RIZ6_9TELE|nr:hypothetical protein QTP70_000728 [Hemibagrus guttatus]